MENCRSGEINNVDLWEMDKDKKDIRDKGRLKRGETLDEHSRKDTGLYMERSALCTCELNPPCRIRDIPPLGKGGLKGAVAVDDCKNDTVHQ